MFLFLPNFILIMRIIVKAALIKHTIYIFFIVYKSGLWIRIEIFYKILFDNFEDIQTRIDIFSSLGRTKGAYAIYRMVSVTPVRHKPLFRVEGLLRFASKLAFRKLPMTFFCFSLCSEKGHF